MRRSFVVGAALMIALVFMVTSVSAITWGEPDGNGHPYVGVAVFTDGAAAWLCSGTLLSPTVVHELVLTVWDENG
jgi:hypothetical protein